MYILFYFLDDHHRKYALLGRLRSVAQTISYEVRLALILIFYLVIGISLSIFIIIKLNIYWNKIIIFLPIVGIWLISCIAETNRTPFDFAEGESELVSGFNIEYGRVMFALIFIAEYARIIFIRIIFSIFFFARNTNIILLYFISSVIIRVWIWIRTTLPRYRYDKLINLAWKIYLPIVLTMFILISCWEDVTKFAILLLSFQGNLTIGYLNNLEQVVGMVCEGEVDVDRLSAGMSTAIHQVKKLITDSRKIIV